MCPWLRDLVTSCSRQEVITDWIQEWWAQDSVGRPADSIGLYLDLSVFSNKPRECSTDGSRGLNQSVPCLLARKLNIFQISGFLVGNTFILWNKTFSVLCTLWLDWGRKMMNFSSWDFLQLKTDPTIDSFVCLLQKISPKIDYLFQNEEDSI